MPTVNDIVLEIEKIAKPEYAYEWDNCGLLAGDRLKPVKSVMVTLDVTVAVVEEAIKKRCEMIISHHPLIFKPISSVTTDSYEGEILALLLKNDVALYCAHTSLDIAFGGVNDALCDAFELENVSLFGEIITVGDESVSCARCGTLKNTLSKQQLLQYITAKTGAASLIYNLADKAYTSVALCAGAGEDFGFYAMDCDVFVTGEVKYHTALELKRQNVSFVTIGHYYSEVHIVKYLCASLQKTLNVLKYNVNVIESKINTNPFEN